MQAVLGHQKWDHGLRHSMQREWKLGTGIRQLSLLCVCTRCTGSDYEITGKKLWPIDLKTNHDAETNSSDVEKIKNSRKHNFKDEANNMQLDKQDNQQNNLNNKYIRETLVLKYPDSVFLAVIVFNKLLKCDLILWYEARVNTLSI